LTLRVSVDAAWQLTPEQVAQIRDLARDKSEADARVALSAIPDLEVVDISVSPAILIKTLPGEGKIKVRDE
jgi:hypothetical protein